jgi:hypothetical protein
MGRTLREFIALVAAASVGTVALVLCNIGASAGGFAHPFGNVEPVISAASTILMVGAAITMWRFARHRLGIGKAIFPTVVRVLIASLYIATWVVGVPVVVSNLASTEIAKYKEMRKDENRVYESHPSIRFGLAFPVAPGLILIRHEYQLAGLYGWGGWELHAWYVVGARPIFGMTQWIS